MSADTHMLDDELIRRLSQLAERLEGIRVYL
jgi:predicted transcriptional regulator